MKKFYQKYTLLLVAFVCTMMLMPASLYAQSPTRVEGQVVSESKEPLLGVAVIVEGTTRGAVTGIDGRYSIEVEDSAADRLFVSFLGFVDQTIPVAGRQTIDIVLAEGSTELEQLVVVGYGVQKKETLTGSIEIIASDVFEDRPVANPALALQGQTPGLLVTRSSSRPGNEDVSMQIRGATSVNGGSPLIIIDGIPSVDDTAFYSMNPEDIASITVLKDASAAIYGSRAANGVILVTTKVGSGKAKIELNTSLSINALGIRPVASSMSEYATVWLEAAAQDGADAQYWYWLNEDNLKKMQSGYEGFYTLADNLGGEVYIAESSRYDDMYAPSVSQKHSLSVSGSSEKSSYRFSFGYDENVGVLATTYDGSKKFNVRSNYNIDVNKWFRLETNLSYYKRTDDGPSCGLSSSSIASDPPLFPAVNPYGQWNANFGVSGGVNSVAETVDGGRESTIYDEVKASVNAIFTITPDLKINATASVTNDWERWQKYILTVYTYTWDGEQANNVINDTSYIRESQLATTYENYGVYANYTKKVGKDHNFAALFGVNAEKEQYKYLYAHRSDFEDNGIYDLNLGSEETLVSTDGGASAYGFYSYVGRLNYNYKSKYLAEINFRRDGSSKFADGFKWANFGGASLGWIISEENFMQDIKFLDYLKLRGSYGQMGNQAGISNYSSYSTVSFGTQIFGYDAAYQTTSSLGITSATTTWERVSSVSAGLDFTMFNNRLSGSVDAFHKVNDNMLISVTYPDVLGATAPKSNYGRLETRGWEFALRWADRVKEFSYNIGFNIGDSNNLLTNMEGAESYEAGLNSYREGYPLNSYFLYKTDGFFANQTEVDAYYEAVGNGGEVPSQSSTSTTLRPGDTKKVDIDGDGQINATGGNGGDLMYMGDADPHYYYGLDFGFNYKGFDFSAMFQGVLSQNIVRTGYLAYPFNYQYTNQTPSYIGLTWTEENTSASYPRMTANLDRADWNWANNDFMLQNNRYIRLKSLVIGYTFQNIKALEKLRVYFAGNDLFEFSSIWDGYDPEYGDTTNSSYPFTRTFSFGANLTF